jgi:hypothetical protein
MDFSASAIVGFLPGRQILYPHSGRHGTFIRWDTSRKGATMLEIIKAAQAEAEQSQEKAILILSTPLDESVAQQNHLDLLKSFTGAGVQDENFYLYQVQP